MAADYDRYADAKDDVEASGREVLPRVSGDGIERRLNPVEDLKARLSMWGESSVHHDSDSEAGSEYELLLDPNLPDELSSENKLRNLNRDSTSFDDASQLKDADEEDSPYPEVRAAVRNFDEDLPCNTIRAWVIGISLIFLGASMNTLFSLRNPSISLGPLIAQIIAWPIGHGWAKVMPKRKFRTFGQIWTLNPGPFNIKEHSIIVVMASVSFSVAYATDVILAQIVFYKQNFGTPFQLLLTISTQSLGYGIAGMMRRFLGESAALPRLSSLRSSSLPAESVFRGNISFANLDSISGVHDLAWQSRRSDFDERHV